MSSTQLSNMAPRTVKRFIRKKRPKRFEISRDICTPEDRLDRFSRNAQAMNWIEVTKEQFGVLDNKFLIKRFVV